MKTTAYIVLNRRGAARLTKGKPHLARDEIAIGLRLEVPDSAFLAPIVLADLTVPDHAVIVPEVSVELVDQPTSGGLLDEQGEVGR